MDVCDVKEMSEFNKKMIKKNNIECPLDNIKKIKQEN